MKKQQDLGGGRRGKAPSRFRRPECLGARAGLDLEGLRT